MAALAAVAGCGFAPRREPEFAFQTLALVGFAPNSAMAAELRQQLQRSDLKLVGDPNRAQVVLHAKLDQRDKTSVVSTTAGQVREWQLRLQLDYQVRSPQGEVLVPQTALLMTRELNFTEAQALGKAQEEELLFRAMQYDAAAQVMRRLAALRLPG